MKNIAIVGGGLVGSLLSIYLAQQGFDVEVYERRKDMRHGPVEGGRSINLALSNRGWWALEEVGIADEIRKLAIPMEGRMIHNLDGTLAFQPYGKEGEAIYSVSRGGLNNMLDNYSIQLPKVNYFYEHKCEKVDIEEGILTVQNLQTGATFTKKPDLIIGADGAFSKVRSFMQRRKRFNYAQEFLEHAYKELTIPAGPNGTWQIEKKALHIWPRRSFMLIALPNLDGSFTCTLFQAFEGKDSLEHLQTPEAVLAFFKEEFPDALDLMPTLVEDFFDNPTDALVTIRCFPWTYQNNILLIGDASHAIVPFYGQGMNSGFEDCRVLNQIIKENQKGDQVDWATICEQYDDSRKPDAEAIADLALKNFVEMRDDVADSLFLLRKKIEKHLNKKYPSDFTPAYSLVTFSEKVRYSEALRRAKIQDQLFEGLMASEGVEARWEAGELDAELDEMVERYKQLTKF